MSSTREESLVELVDEEGTSIGSSTVAAAHTAPGQLHRAFSVVLFDDRGRTLLQQRSQVKTRFPSRWANACCGHPAPGQAVTDAAARRLDEELRLANVALAEVGVYAYEAIDPATGRVEKEYDHVVVGRVPGDLAVAADPAEVAGVRWAAARSLVTDAVDGRYAPWLRGVLEVALSVIDRPRRA